MTVQLIRVFGLGTDTARHAQIYIKRKYADLVVSQFAPCHRKAYQMDIHGAADVGPFLKLIVSKNTATQNAEWTACARNVNPNTAQKR